MNKEQETEYHRAIDERAQVLPMTQNLFKTRKRLISCVNEAKAILKRHDLPWVKFRIGKYADSWYEEADGTSWNNVNFVTIRECVREYGNIELTRLVWHELCHSWFGAPHNEECPLMCSYTPEPLPKKDELVVALQRFKDVPLMRLC